MVIERTSVQFAILEKLIAKNEELSRWAQRINSQYYLNTAASVCIVIMTIVLNALIMAARHLEIPTNIVIIFAVVNLLNKGIELRFKYDHRALLLAEYQKDVKMLDTELHQIYIKARLHTLEREEVICFDADYERVTSTVSHWFKVRDIFGNFSKEDQEVGLGGDVPDAPDDDEDVDHFFAAHRPSSADVKGTLPEGMDAELIYHYYVVIEDVKAAIYKRYRSARFNWLCATCTTLVMNVLIIAALLFYDKPSLIAIMGGMNTVVKGFQLHFKWEIQKDQCERCSSKAKLLDGELMDLMTRHQNGNMETVELESFKRAFIAAFKEMASFMRPANAEC